MSNESITHKKTIIVFVAEINKLLNDFSPPKMDDMCLSILSLSEDLENVDSLTYEKIWNRKLSLQDI